MTAYGRALVVRGDARTLPLPDASVDLVCTSPPFYALRSYTDGGQHYAGQIGSEATPREYITNLIGCTREWMRVLKPTGSIWVDLGDKYSTSMYAHNSVRNVPQSDGDWTLTGRRGKPNRQPWRQEPGVPPKSLMLMPERYRIACVDQLGLIARAVVVWSKPNSLPESVTDRVRRSHEDWVHLVKQPRYFSAVDAIREPHSENTHSRRKDGGLPPKNASGLEAGIRRCYFGDTTFNPLGALPGSVWTIPTEPLTVPEDLGVDHFAAFPTEWPRRIILGWSPSGICTVCGQGRRPVAEVSAAYRQARAASMADRTSAGWATDSGKNWGYENRLIQGGKIRPDHRIVGEVCACPEPTAPTRPSVVLDPFGGTGTTALVARALGRVGITVDRSADYCRLAAWRTTDRGQLAKALRVPPPPKQATGQLDLFGEAV